MPKYRVFWEGEVEARSPLMAAIKAADKLRNENLLLDAVDKDGITTCVDVSDKEACEIRNMPRECVILCWDSSKPDNPVLAVEIEESDACIYRSMEEAQEVDARLKKELENYKSIILPTRRSLD